MVRNTAFISHEVTFEEAAESIDCFENQLADSDVLKVVRLIRKTNPESGWTTLVYKLDGKLPHRVNRTAARILQDLRHSLDQAVYHYAKILDQSKKLGKLNPKKTCFPIDADPNKNKSLHPQFRTAILAIAERELENLSLLNDLCNECKHRDLVNVTLSVGVLYPIEAIMSGPRRIYVDWDDLSGELEFMSIAPDGVFDLSSLPTPKFEPVILGSGRTYLPAFSTFRKFHSDVRRVLTLITEEADRLLNS